jgi:hypothetical protein
MSIYYNRSANLARLKNWQLINETHKQNIQYKIDRTISSMNHAEWNNKRDVEYVIRKDFYPELVVNEDATYVPRFSIKKYSHPIFAEFPPNKELKYSRELMIKAIEYGMILMIQYRGDTGESRDNFVQGHQRVVYPLVLGTSAKGKPLLRAYHLRGWSVSKNGNINKDWRMFRTDRILSMSFTGSFFRLAPDGYNSKDKGMRGGIIKAADFDEITKMQKTLVRKDVIQNKREVVLDDKKKVVVVQVDSTNTVLDLNSPFDNPNIKEADKKLIRMTFLKSIHDGKHIAIVGALGQRGHLVKLTSRGKYLGTFRVLRSVMGDHLNKPHLKRVEGKAEFELYVFVKKVDTGAPLQQTKPVEKPADVEKEAEVEVPEVEAPETEVKEKPKAEPKEPKFTQLASKVAQINKRIPQQEKPAEKKPKFLDLMDKIAKINGRIPPQENK